MLLRFCTASLSRVSSGAITRSCIPKNNHTATRKCVPRKSYSVFSRAPSAAGFNNYDEDRKSFQLPSPEYYNFARDIIDKWAVAEKTRASSRPAFWWVDDEGHEVQWTYKQLSEKSKRIAKFLEGACGVKAGDRVLVILPRIPEWWLINIACMRIGAVLIPGTTLLTPKDIHSRLARSEAKSVIVDSPVADSIDEIIGQCPLVQTKILVDRKSKRPGWQSFHDLYEMSNSEHECINSRSNDPMTIFFTSGTTGEPKMTEHTHASYGLAHYISGKFWMDLTTQDIHWNISDTGWAKSAWSNIFAPWILGACVFVYKTTQFNPVDSMEILQKYPISTFCAAPTVYRMMVQEKFSDYDFTSVRHFMSAGEPLNPEVIEEWAQTTNQFIREGYGQTETVLLGAMYRCIEPRLGSLGKPPPGMDVRIISETGDEVDPGVEGDIALKVSPNRPIGLFSRYVDESKREEAVFRGDYYVTGDRAKSDEEGYLYFVGRDDDVISSAGYRIGPFEVESALIEHDAVAESAVVSSPDPVRHEIVKAFVVLSGNYQTRTDDYKLIEELQEHVRRTTAPYKYPRKIEFVESLPKTVSGKIRRVELRNMEWKRT